MTFVSGCGVKFLYLVIAWVLTGWVPPAPTIPQSIKSALPRIAQTTNSGSAQRKTATIEWEVTATEEGVCPSIRPHDLRPHVLGTAPDKSEQQKYPELQEALQNLGTREPGWVLAKLKSASLKYAELPSEYVILYRILDRADEAKAARDCLEWAIAETPSDPEPWLICGCIALGDNRLGEAELDLTKARQLLVDYTNVDRKRIVEPCVLNALAAIAERHQKWHQAEARLEEYLKKSPDDMVGWQRLAYAKFWQSSDNQQVKEAYESLQQAKMIDARNAKKNRTPEQMLPPASILAQFYDARERKTPFAGPSKNAENMFLFALKSNPDNQKLRYIVGIWALENGETALARDQVKELRRINAINPRAKIEDPDALMLCGMVALWEKRWADAEDNFNKVFIAEPNRFDVRNGLALALVEQNGPAKKEKALDLAYANYQNNKDNNHSTEAAATLSWVYFRMGKFDLASAAMDAILRAMNGNVSDPNTATYMAYVLDHNDNGHNGLKYKAKQVLESEIKTGRPFRMKPEAEELYKNLKDEKAPEGP
jgi:predicted Zn-dependent protease